MHTRRSSRHLRDALGGAGSSHTITVRVTAPSPEGATAAVLIVARSADDPTRADQVGADLSTGQQIGRRVP